MKAKLLIAAALFGVACATVPPPKELTEAKRLYERERHSQTAQVNPAGLHEAAKAIAVANREYEEHPRSIETKDLSYVALRKVQLAEANATVDLALIQRSKLERERVAKLESEMKRTQAELDLANQKLAEGTRSATVIMPPPPPAPVAAAPEEPEEPARPKREERGEVLTLSGSFTFKSGDSELLEGAHAKLDQVAETLIRARPPGIVITGYTDSQGSAKLNKDLSRLRAEAVRDYLVEKGVPPEGIRTEGKGEADPIADNSSSEGRAMNRRVEITLLKAVSSR